MKIHNSQFRVSLLTLFLLINFLFIACEENKVLTGEDTAQNNEGVNLVKADLSELIGEIEGSNASLTALLKDNPVSKLKESNLEKSNRFEFLFDTDNIMALRINNDHVIYMIPAYKSNNERDNNLYSVSINIDGNIIDTKLTTIEISSDGTQTNNTREFNFSNLTSKNQTYATYVDMEIKCDCVASISDCTCHTSHASGGCDHPDVSISCTNCSGGSGISITNPSSHTNNNTQTSNNQIVAISNSSSGSNYGYTYSLSGNSVYIGLMKKYQPDYVFSALQKYNIINTPEISNPLLQFLDIDGSSKMNKDFALTIINAIEEGTVTTYQEFNVLLNVYKKAKVALLIEEQIDDTLLDPCTKAILEKLKNLKQNDIAGILAKFGVPVNGTYTLKIVIGTPDKPVAIADTRQVSKNNYLITIRETYLKGTENDLRPPTDLAIAAIVIHEIIHAHFFALYDDFRNNGNICAYDNYDCLFMKYVTDNFEGTTDPHHSQMFENYLDVMANALQEFQTGIPVPNTEKAALFYHDLALSTMAGTRIFEDRYPLGYNSPTYEERKRITYNREAEDDNKTIDDAENGKYIPKGKPCTN